MEQNNRLTIFLAGYPKSGTTYATRLLGDALNCPTGGNRAADDKTEPAAEGSDRPGPYLVRKGHYRICNRPGAPIVPEGHWLNASAFDCSKHRAIWLIRDPRDVIVSGAYYWRRSVKDQFDLVVKGEAALHISYCDYLDMWIRPTRVSYTLWRFEDLVANPVETLLQWSYREGIPILEGRAIDAAKRQSIAATKKRINKRGDQMNLGMALNKRLVRKGQPGDWRNHFDKSLAHKAALIFNEYLIAFKYEENGDWWKNV